jgi:hypothetical protein
MGAESAKIKYAHWRKSVAVRDWGCTWILVKKTRPFTVSSRGPRQLKNEDSEAMISSVSVSLLERIPS